MNFLHRLALLPLAALLTLGGTPACAQQAAGSAAPAPSPCSSHLRQQRSHADLDATYNPCRLQDGEVDSGARLNDGDSRRQDWNDSAAEAPRHRFLDLGEQHALGLALNAGLPGGDLGWRQGALPGWRIAMEEEAGHSWEPLPPAVHWWRTEAPGWLRSGGVDGPGRFGLGGGPLTSRQGGAAASAPVPEPATWLSLLLGLALLSAGKARRAARR
ncbi:PEP-CTERM sorting domain-containing protein [Massilia sp. erpn]|uniref:PEP-CTERM sorting domain-containing protein n=1 Tax=Massilia sp. erpn TaxID=2738142 RepID=UPI00210231E5|nr:PEP-CTERM sorting domain-containing protein [Massilia sp. erpn]UTY55773.1 PEP-CTERM sorting domain-containing protein [Massilia sp. erpn]